MRTGGGVAWRIAGKNRVAAERRALLAGEAAAEAATCGAESEPPSARPVPTDLTAGAFFDVDNTLIAGASMFHFARGLAARKYFSNSDLASFAWQQMKFRVGGRESSGGIST
ncbi:MAG: HAD-IB family hydrolase, partial [Sciscionella sp.]